MVGQQQMATCSPLAAHAQNNLTLLAAVPTSACTSPQPGVGTGTLPLCQSVMRFLLGCLDRKSQPEYVKSLSKPQQPPAPALAPTVLPGWHQHQLHPGAPTALLGLGSPWDVQSRGFSTCLSHWPLSQPHTGTGAASPCPGWEWQVHPWGPQAACQHRVHGLSCHPECQHLHPSAARCRFSAVWSWHSGTVSAEPVCAGRHHAVLLATSFSPTAAANPSPQKVESDSVAAGGYRLCQDELCCTS